MCSRSRTKILNLVFVAAAIPGGTFRICAEPDNLPLSQKSSNSGLEIDLGQILAQAMNKKLEVEWIPQHDQTYFRSTIGAGQCDAVMGVPSGFERLELTKPLYKTAFAFVSRKEKAVAPVSYDDPHLKALTIGVPVTGDGDIPPTTALTLRNLTKNLRAYSLFDNREMIDAVADGKIDAAIIWGPFAGWYSSDQKVPLNVSFAPQMDHGQLTYFDTMIGVKKGNHELKDELNKAIDAHQAEILAVLTKWHVPLRR
jgi:mxaJ protein